MRFHVLGLSHYPTTKAVSWCAFTIKAYGLCKMLVAEGHEVIFYGVEGSNPPCSENVTVLSEATRASVHGKLDARFLDLGMTNAAFQTFTVNAIAEIAKRKRPGDFLLCPFGVGHKPIADAHSSMIVVESGIGYSDTFAKFRVFESYAWMHYHYGKDNRALSPSLYDTVIPNYIDMADFPYQLPKRPYFIFVGRPTPLKGLGVAIDVCKTIGAKLYAAGQGDAPAGVEHLGVLSIEERAKWVGGARALFAPTYYIEPFGTVALEAMAYGTPVITTDLGAFTETVVQGKTGFRCRTFAEFVDAARNIKRIKRRDCRKWAENYSMERIGPRYTDYFRSLAVLHSDPRGWYAV